MGETSALPLSLRRRSKEMPEAVTMTTALWEPNQTALIVCDMWNTHWCAGAARRVDELAPVMDEVLKAARAKGVFIIHAPSDTLDFYADTPQRRRAQSAPRIPLPEGTNTWLSLDEAYEGRLPIDDSDNGCDDEPTCPVHSPWTRQHLGITIAEEDAITDDGEEVNSLFHAYGIKQVLMMGVHTNMCVLGRPFGIRRLVRLGMEVALVRDMTDAMYNSRMQPYVDHFHGVDLVVEHIERHWCPTITSDQIVGGKPFRFAGDTRPTP